MFIMILEGGEPMYCQSVTEDDLNAADGGILEIIDLTPVPPKTYFDGEWVELEKWEV